MNNPAVNVECPWFAVMVAETFAVTTLVETVKVAEVAPAGTVMVTGTDPAGSEIDRLTVEPPTGAGAERVTLPVTELPPATLDAEREKPLRIAGFRVIDADLVIFPDVAVIVADSDDPTREVVTVKLADVCPAVNVTEPGTLTSFLLDPRVIVIPLAGAGLPRVRLPINVAPPTTDAGATVNRKDEAGSIVKGCETVMPPCVADIVGVVTEVTFDVVT